MDTKHITQPSILTWLVIGLVLLVMASGVHAQDTPQAMNKANVLAFIEGVYNNGDTSMLDTLFAPDYVFHPGEVDINSVRGNMLGLRAAIPDLQAIPVVAVAQENWVAVHILLNGTFTNEMILPNAAPLPATNESIQFVTNMVFRLNEQGQIAEQWVTFDNLSYLAQIGGFEMEPIIWGGPTEPAVVTPTGNEEGHAIAALLYYDALNNADFTALEQQLAENSISYNPFGSLDRAGQVSDLSALRAALPDMSVAINQLIAEGEYVAAFYQLQGTFSAPFVLPDGTPFQPPAAPPTIDLLKIDFLHFNAEGKIDATYEMYDSWDFLLQLGIVAEQPQP